MKNNKKGFNLLSVIIVICITSIISGLTTGVIVTNSYKNNLGLTYEDLVNDESLNEFLEVYSSIINNYYEDVDTSAMIDSAVDGMLDYLGESYTTYLDKDATEELEERLSGSYRGIGIAVANKVIQSITSGTPAAESGLQVGDIITGVDGVDVTQKSNEELTDLIKETDKDSIKLTVQRGEETLTFDIGLATIPISAVNYQMLENNVGYLQMEIFSATLDEQVTNALDDLENQGMQKLIIDLRNNTGGYLESAEATASLFLEMEIFSATLEEQVANALSDLESQGMQKLIIDLRNNTGGYLESAEKTASLFLEKGKLIYSLENKDATAEYYDKTDENTSYPIVILINGQSASAAEILAAALKDSYGAVLVGEKSYGKGKVQQTYNLSDGSMAKYTPARWLRPNGDCIDGVGLMPDYIANLTYTYDDTGKINGTIDTQLNKAIEVISAM